MVPTGAHNWQTGLCESDGFETEAYYWSSRTKACYTRIKDCKKLAVRK